jgi:hypothetical protein
MKRKSVRELKGYSFEDPYKGDFYCISKQLTSLEGCPKVVNGNFYCNNNNLQSLQYCPQLVNGSFHCGNNKLQSLQYCPQIVKGHFNCDHNKLQSLQNIHKYCKQLDKQLWAFNNPIKSHVLGVMLIENIKHIILSTDRNNKLQTIENIINTHIKTDRDVYLCQDNLIKAGFAEYAQL